MIKRIFILAAVFFVLYNLCLIAMPLRDRFVVQSQAQENIAKAQEFLLDTHTVPFVVVGSSLGARLTEERLGPKFCNLAFSGGSAFTGLELIERRPGATKIVFIETNMLMRGKDEGVLANAFRPVFSNLRNYLPGLRERWQPANFVAGKVGEKIVAGALSPLTRMHSQTQKNNSPDNQDVLFQRLLADEHGIYANAPDQIKLGAQIDKLKERVKGFEARGIRCVFVEMPIDASLIDLPLASTVRSALFEGFPPRSYRWVLPQAGRKYITTDGSHLTGEEAVDFGNRLRTCSEEHL